MVAEEGLEASRTRLTVISQPAAFDGWMGKHLITIDRPATFQSAAVISDALVPRVLLFGFVEPPVRQPAGLYVILGSQFGRVVSLVSLSTSQLRCLCWSVRMRSPIQVPRR